MMVLDVLLINLSIFLSNMLVCLSSSRSVERELSVNSELGGVEDIVRNMQAIDRAILGFMCKDIIDAGRLMWLKAQGLKSELVKYVPITISPENRLLVAW